MRKFFSISLMCLFSGVGMNANAAPSTKQPNSAQQSVVDGTWYSQPKAIIRVLNKLESSVTMLTIPVGGFAQYKTLTITVKRCIVRPEMLSPDSAAFVSVTDSQLPTNPFNAWIFVAEPGASVFEHPLYNVSLAGCAGEINKKPTTMNASPVTQPQQTNSPNDLEQSLERSIQSQH